MLCKDRAASTMALQKPQPWLPAMETMLIELHPERITLRYTDCSGSFIFMLHLRSIFFNGLQDDQLALATKFQLELTTVFKDEEWVLQSAES